MKVYVVVVGEYTAPINNLVGVYYNKASAWKARDEALEYDEIFADVIECEVEK